MRIYNVLLKAVEKAHRFNPSCRAFGSEEEAMAHIKKNSHIHRLTLRSSMEFEDDSVDFRYEDTEGDSYYYVIFKQELNEN